MSETYEVLPTKAQLIMNISQGYGRISGKGSVVTGDGKYIKALVAEGRAFVVDKGTSASDSAEA